MIVRSIVEAANGTVFKHTGDGFGAVFESVTAGLEAAAGVAAALAHQVWEGPASYPTAPVLRLADPKQRR